MSTKFPNTNEAIAVIGMAGRFPNAEDVQAFWRNLEEGVESLVEFSDAEILDAGIPPELLQNPNYVKRGTPFDRPDWFDAGFFGFNPREAEVLDPQHRLLLECAWEALEDSGYGGETRPESIGVYAGASGNSYLLNNVLANPEVIESVGGYQIMLASDKDFLATRIAYKLNLKGPSMSIQTACSTSLVAVQVACQALFARQCDLALAGGVSLSFPEKSGHLYNEGMIQSPDGRCRPFDAEGRGIRAGHGAGIVVLKRLSDAVRDGDAIRAVILGAAINNDGAAKMGYSAPSIEGQSTVISAAIRMSGVDAASISFVEAHGTGTQVGDPIEIAGLERAFRLHTDKKQFCAIGAVKGNIGHLDAAAGVAGLIKTVLALQHKRIPPTLHFRKANPAIDFADSPFYVNDKLSQWKSNGAPRRAGISSFGIGGTNAHAVLEEAPAPQPSEILWPEQLLVLSARSATALDAMAARLAQHLEANSAISWGDTCYTAQIGRRRFPHRRMVVCANREEAVAALSGTGKRKTVSAVEETNSRSVTFMFSGQGSQHAGMARGLYEFQPAFRSHMDFCAEFLADDLGCDLRKLLFAQNADSELLNETRIAQPALFSIEYALARMWMSWGVLPDAMIGHSIGEYAAACLAGVFSLEDALRMVAARGKIMQEMPAGSMLAVSLPVAEARRYVDERIALAAVNSPSFCTLSGPQAAIADLKAKLESRRIDCRELHTSHAFHSSMMDGALDRFADVIRNVKLAAPDRRYISNLTGTWIKPEQATDPSYWLQHLRQTVYFAPGISELAAAPGRIFLEVGPGQTLNTFARDCTRGAAGCQVLSCLPHPKDPQSDVSFLLNTVGKLWLAGVPIDWDAFHKGERLHRVSLPTYFFERKRYCVEPVAPLGKSNSRTSSTASGAPDAFARRADISDWFYVPSWQRTVAPVAIASNESYGPWLVFSDDRNAVDGSGIGEQVARVLAGRGEPFTIVRRGREYSRLENGEYTIRPGRSDDYGLLLNDIQSRGLAPRSVLHLWSITDRKQGDAGNGRQAFDSLLMLAQAFGDAPAQAPVDWIIVTSGLQTVTGQETLDPEQALVVGPAKVIPLEYSNITCRMVDIRINTRIGAGPGSVQDNSGDLIESLLLEPGTPRPWRPVAYRDGYRWEQSFESVRFPARLPDRATRATREKGVYLITGGTGGIGFTIAAYLAEHGNARLALLGRAKFPDRSQWQIWMEEHGESDPTSVKIRNVERLESLGAEVLLLSADVSDRQEMDAALRVVQERWGALNGVVHAAGVFVGGLVQLKTPEISDQALAAKFAGTMVLDSLLDIPALDFFILCSSIDAFTSTPGAVDYCAANAFLDAYAMAQRKMGRTNVTSVNWDTWKEVGMTLSELPRNVTEQRRRKIEKGIRPAEGAEAFRRALAARLPQIAVSPLDLPSVVADNAKTNKQVEYARPLDGSGAHRAAEAGHARPNLANAFAAAETDTQKQLTEIWIEVLGISEIGIDDNFFEMGGHSLLATGVLSRVRSAFGVSVPLRTIFETPTIRQFSNHLETLLWIVSGKSTTSSETEEREEIEI